MSAVESPGLLQGGRCLAPVALQGRLGMPPRRKEKGGRGGDVPRSRRAPPSALPKEEGSREVRGKVGEKGAMMGRGLWHRGQGMGTPPHLELCIKTKLLWIYNI